MTKEHENNTLTLEQALNELALLKSETNKSSFQISHNSKDNVWKIYFCNKYRFSPFCSPSLLEATIKAIDYIKANRKNLDHPKPYCLK